MGGVTGLPRTSARSVIGKALACAARADLHRRRVRGQVARACCQGTRWRSEAESLRQS